MDNYYISASIKFDKATGEYTYYVVEETGPDEEDSHYIVYGSTPSRREAVKSIHDAINEAFK